MLRQSADTKSFTQNIVVVPAVCFCEERAKLHLIKVEVKVKVLQSFLPRWVHIKLLDCSSYGFYCNKFDVM